MQSCISFLSKEFITHVSFCMHSSPPVKQRGETKTWQPWNYRCVRQEKQDDLRLHKYKMRIMTTFMQYLQFNVPHTYLIRKVKPKRRGLLPVCVRQVQQKMWRILNLLPKFHCFTVYVDFLETNTNIQRRFYWYKWLDRWPLSEVTSLENGQSRVLSWRSEWKINQLKW